MVSRVPRVCWLFLMLALTACAGGGESEWERQDFQMLFDKGRAYLERGNARMALPALQRAQRLQPDNVTLLAMLGLAYDQVGRPVQALRVLEDAHRLSPEDGNLSNNLGVARSRLHAACVAKQEKPCQAWLDKADAAFTMALQDPYLRVPEEVWFNRALLYKAHGHLRQMVAALEKSLTISDRYVPTCLELADYYRTMHRPDRERPYVQCALAVRPEDVGLLERLADSFQASGEWIEVRALLARILAMAPGPDVAQLVSHRLFLLDKER